VNDAEHWLWRLDAAAWSAAAEVELDAARASLAKRRTAIAHCRRAAGMALNAVLVASRDRDDVEHMWGRSYVEHLQHLAAGTTGPLGTEAVAAAAAILATPMTPPPLVGLGRTAHADLTQLVEHTRHLLDLCAAARDAAAL
jgi:hypothetical protein